MQGDTGEESTRRLAALQGRTEASPIFMIKQELGFRDAWTTLTSFKFSCIAI